jgi:hypothetical protein
MEGNNKLEIRRNGVGSLLFYLKDEAAGFLRNVGAWPTRLHGATSQKTVISIVTAVRSGHAVA